MAARKGNEKFRREGKILKVGKRVTGLGKEERKGCDGEWRRGRNMRPCVVKKRWQRKEEKKREQDVQEVERACACGKHEYR